MADRRIHIPKEYEELVNRLCNANDDEYNGPFKLKADVLAFAAAYGASEGKHKPLSETVKDPIRWGVFETAGYGTLINLLAVSRTQDPNVLAQSDDMEDKRASIFEEYANGGLQLLSSSLQDETDYTSSMNLVISKKSPTNKKYRSGIDISTLVE